MSTTYHIRIKKEAEASVIAELRKNEAIEFVPDEEAFDIPEWQKELVRKRIEKYKNNAGQLINEDEFYRMLNED